MWRVGVLVVLVLSIVFASEAAEHRYGSHLQRLKRSPYYDCPPYGRDPPYGRGPPYGGGPPPRFWPPPPHHHHFGPPPFWPPSPPEDNNQEQVSSQAQSSAHSGALTQLSGQNGPQQQPGQNNQWPGPGNPGKDQGSSGRGLSQDGEQNQGNQPCDTCGGKGQLSAVSNAKSDSGSAIAIAISGKNGGK